MAEIMIPPKILVSKVSIPAIAFNPVTFSTPFSKLAPNVCGHCVKIALIKVLNIK